VRNAIDLLKKTGIKCTFVNEVCTQNEEADMCIFCKPAMQHLLDTNISSLNHQTEMWPCLHVLSVMILMPEYSLAKGQIRDENILKCQQLLSCLAQMYEKSFPDYIPSLDMIAQVHLYEKNKKP